MDEFGDEEGGEDLGLDGEEEDPKFAFDHVMNAMNKLRTMRESRKGAK